MREDELRKYAECSVCKKKIGHAGLPIFWTIRIERHGLDRAALERQQGLTMMLGGEAALARAMGPDEEMTTLLMDPVVASVCEPCSLKQICIAQIAEEVGNG